MNCFSQLENGIFATEKDIQELKNKASAHILVYSDSHGKAPVVRDIFEKFGQKCDAAIFAGVYCKSNGCKCCCLRTFPYSCRK